jgi:hypothetical protein
MRHRGLRQSLRRCVFADDLGCAMIPPQTEEEVAESFAVLCSQAGEIQKHVESRKECAEIAAACAALQTAAEAVSVCRRD